MNQLEILEGNKLIAEFMGYKVIYYKETKEYGVNGEPLSCYNYNSSWSLLMPVVEKIEHLGFPTKIRADYLRHKLDYSMEVFNKDNGDLLIENDFGYESKINCVLETVIEFIKWYNQ